MEPLSQKGNGPSLPRVFFCLEALFAKSRSRLGGQVVAMTMCFPSGRPGIFGKKDARLYMDADTTRM